MSPRTLAGAAVLETATADDVSRGSAMMRTRDGEVVRVQVGGWFAGSAVLTAVSDVDATFASNGASVTLPVTPLLAPQSASLPPGGERYTAPAVVNPGIARR